ncbi:type II CAAX prenyl endopeptidase Rce1 family protein [Staphylococcus lutrae]
MLPLIGTGLIFCWVYHKTGKIINNIILHSSYNLTLLVMYQIFVSYL